MTSRVNIYDTSSLLLPSPVRKKKPYTSWRDVSSHVEIGTVACDVAGPSLIDAAAGTT